MKNITDDLRERVSELEFEITEAQRELESLLDRKVSLMVLIAVEESRWKTREQPPLMPDLTPSLPLNTKSLPPLSQFLLSSLKDGGKTLEQLKNDVRNSNISIKAAKPGRGIAVALFKLSTKGLTEKKDGKWKLKNENTIGMAGRPSDLRASSAPTHPA